MKRCAWLACAVLLVGCRDGSIGVNQSAIGESINHPWNHDDDKLIAPIWSGDDDRGSLVSPMYRGASAGIEDYIFTPSDGDCANARGIFRIDWDKKKNQVHYQVKYKKVPVHPAVHRTEGVDYFSDAFHAAPKDFTNGGYRFWTILSAQNGTSKTFYYDPTTLLILGSEYDFPSGPPTGAIPVVIPVFTLFTTHLMFADSDGSLFHEYTVPYDHLTVEGGAYSLAYATYIPLDLCESNKFQPTLGQLRPWVSPWLNSPSVSWHDVLDNGPVFDTTTDENQAFPATHGFEPYVYSGVAFIGNETVFQGGVPNGYRNDLSSVILQVVPGIRPLEHGGNGPGCGSFVVDPHVTAPRFCEGAH